VGGPTYSRQWGIRRGGNEGAARKSNVAGASAGEFDLGKNLGRGREGRVLLHPTDRIQRNAFRGMTGMNGAREVNRGARCKKVSGTSGLKGEIIRAGEGELCQR